MSGNKLGYVYLMEEAFSNQNSLKALRKQKKVCENETKWDRKVEDRVGKVGMIKTCRTFWKIGSFLNDYYIFKDYSSSSMRGGLEEENHIIFFFF